MTRNHSPRHPGAYDVGYGKPPETGRFQKGQSGNPHGRPRKSPSSEPVLPSFKTEQAALAYKIATRPVTIRDGDKTETVPVLEAVLRAEAAQAARGKRLDKKDMLERHAKAEAELYAEQLEDFEAWSLIKKFLIEQRENTDEDKLAFPLPHPDDVVLGPGLKVAIIGPINAAELATVESTCALRALLLIENILDLKLRRTFLKTPGNEKYMPLSTVYLTMVEHFIPKRFQIGLAGFASVQKGYLSKTAAELESEISTMRQDLGNPLFGRYRPRAMVTHAQAKMFFRALRGPG